ncbi:SprT family protein [Tenuibacillus multivorans]|uniref:Protein SprT-like n=1 Tax=Tenuibacillus multivorans TaxID=237069 RepID=A0A1H0BC70_9BACI|nr:SprT family protein [Tenuibacillus multivorans]GEL78782.1 protein SprT [Tenuibacillus multivorans]SDN42973.1 SprT-like protein [Tenuibacillus multivorans]
MNDSKLKALIEKISFEYFNKPFVGNAKFNGRLRTTGGRYIPSQNIIEINPKYLHELGEEDLIGIIKHELCHYHLHIAGKPYNHRSKEFRELLRKTGSPRFCRMLPSEEQKKRIKYKCETCGTEYQRKRRINLNKYRCGKCRGKLKLIN